MAGRKLLYMLRGPLPAGRAESLLPDGASSSFEDDISVVLLDDAIADNRSLPGRTFLLQESHETPLPESDTTRISYTDLLKMIIDADSTVVI